MVEIKKDALNSNKKQEKKTVWHCDIYCRKIRHVTCEGQENVSEDAPDLCPYFDEMLY